MKIDERWKEDETMVEVQMKVVRFVQEIKWQLSGLK
jgi:hypothetical protein